jgi:hypothetical protein
MEGLRFDLCDEAHLQTLTEEVVKSSEVETLAREQVRSSIARQLGMDVAGLVSSDRNIDGIVEMMLDATGNRAAPLTEGRLLAGMLFFSLQGAAGCTKLWSASGPLIWVALALRDFIISDRTRWMACISCCSMVLSDTNPIEGLLIASQIASASFRSVLLLFT